MKNALLRIIKFHPFKSGFLFFSFIGFVVFTVLQHLFKPHPPYFQLIATPLLFIAMILFPWVMHLYRLLLSEASLDSKPNVLENDLKIRSNEFGGSFLQVSKNITPSLIEGHTDILSYLHKIPFNFRIAFAVSCAERIFIGFTMYCEKANTGDPEYVRNVLDLIWSYLLENKELTNPKDYIDPLGKQIDDETFDCYMESNYAVESLSCIMCVLRLMDSKDVQNAIRAGQHAIDFIDCFTGNDKRFDYSQNPEVKRSLFQKEINCQRRDLLLLFNTTKDNELNTMRMIRESSQKEAENILDIV
jgi:uncharacterized protein YjaG (DUF416 family)